MKNIDHSQRILMVWGMTNCFMQKGILTLRRILELINETK